MVRDPYALTAEAQENCFWAAFLEHLECWLLAASHALKVFFFIFLTLIRPSRAVFLGLRRETDNRDTNHLEKPQSSFVITGSDTASERREPHLGGEDASSAEAQRETDPYVELAALMASLRQGTLHLVNLLVDVAVDGLRRRANRARGGAEHLAVPVLVLDEPKLDAAAAAGKQRHVHAALLALREAPPLADALVDYLARATVLVGAEAWAELGEASSGAEDPFWRRRRRRGGGRRRRGRG